jgi:hypothetical protein
MDEFLCSCCCEPIYVETDYWFPDVPDVADPANPYVDPTYVEPAYVEPVNVEPVYVDPVYVEPAYVEPAYVEPIYVEPAYVDPVYVDPLYVEPVYVEPLFVEPAYVEPMVAPVTLAPLTAEIGGWEPGFTVISPDASVASPTVLANVPTTVSGYDPGISLAEALASPSFGGNPWDSSHIVEMRNMSAGFLNNVGSAPVLAPLTNADLTAAMSLHTLQTNQTIYNATRATAFNLMNSGW